MREGFRPQIGSTHLRLFVPEGVCLVRYFIGIVAVISALAALPADAAFIRGGKPIKGRYIVTLHDNVHGNVGALATALTRGHQGRLLATMEHAMRGFGVEMTEARAIALSHHPWVKLVEEDEEFQLSGAPGLFDFSSTKKPSRIETNADACPWQGSYYLCSYANDTFWALDRIDNAAGIYSTKAYAYYSTGQGVRAYVVDSGVYKDHVEFYAGQVEAGANMMVDPDIADPIDPQSEPREEPPVALDSSPADYPCNAWTSDYFVSHGTGVASALAGQTTGVAKRATIVPVKVMNCGGQRPKLAIARGLDWIMADMATKPAGTRAVVNMSVFMLLNSSSPNGTLIKDQVCETSAGSSTFTNCVSAIENEVATLVSQNIPVVVSANNQNTDTCSGAGTTSPARMGYGGDSTFPSTHRTITAGGSMIASTYADARWTCAATPQNCAAPFQNELGSNYGPCVSIWAPAANVRVAFTSSATSYRPADGSSSGTSFSAPFTAGVVARLLQRYPTLTSTQVWQALVTRANLRSSTPDFDPSSTVNTKLIYMSATE